MTVTAMLVETIFKGGFRKALLAVVRPSAQDPVSHKQRDSSFQCAMGKGERNGFSCSDGHVKEPLCLQDGGVILHSEVPWDAEKRKTRGVLGDWCGIHPVCALVLAVLMALALALAVALVEQTARGHGGNPDPTVAPVLACPDDWVGYRNVCYYFSVAEGGWEWCQDQCSSHGASLAVPVKEWEMEFLGRLKGQNDYWLGLRRQGERLECVDGSSFNQTIPVQGQGGCVYLNDYALATSRCSQHRQYLCSKPQAVM